VTINREGIITDANRAASDLTGHPRERIIGAAFKDFFDDPDWAQDGVRRTFEQGEVRDYQMNLATSSGATLAVSFNATLYRDSSDQVQGVFAIARPQR
jgi:PAS domain S-box-containing protein